MQGAIGSVIFRITVPTKSFSPLEIGQDRCVRPSGISELVPVVVIPRMATNINHGINAGRPPPAAPARPVHLTPTQARLGFCLETIILIIGLGHEAGITSGHMNEQIFILPPCLNQQNLIFLIFRQTRRKHTARTAGPHDDVIDFFSFR